MLTCNNVILIGNLGADPELRYTQSGTAVANFNIAVARQQKDEVDWISIVCWQKTAEAASQYLVKGQAVLVEGRLQTRNYEDKNGNKRYVTEVVANSLKFGSKPGQAQVQSGQAPQDDFSGVGNSDDLPF